MLAQRAAPLCDGVIVTGGRGWVARAAHARPAQPASVAQWHSGWAPSCCSHRESGTRCGVRSCGSPWREGGVARLCNPWVHGRRERPRRQLRRLYDGDSSAPQPAAGVGSEDDDDDDVLEPLPGLGGPRGQAPQTALFAHLSGLGAPSAQTASGASALFPSPRNRFFFGEL